MMHRSANTLRAVGEARMNESAQWRSTLKRLLQVAALGTAAAVPDLHHSA